MVSLSTGTLWHHGLERAVSIGTLAGFEAFELMLRTPGSDGYTDSWDVPYLRSLEAKYGARFLSVHTDFGMEKEPRGMNEVLALADALEAEHIVVHIPRRKYREYTTWFRQFVSSGILALDERILVENMGENAIYRSVRKFNSFPNFCFDTCHSMKAGEDTLQMIKELTNVRQIHVSNYDGTHTHVGLNGQKQFFAEVLRSHPEATKCVEMSPQAFRDVFDKEHMVRVLASTREFLERYDQNRS